MLVRMVVQELLAPHSQVQAALAAPCEVVQAIAQAGPYTFHRVTVPPCPVQVTTRILTRTMLDRPLVIVSLGTMRDIGCISEALRPALPLSNAARFARCGAPRLPYCQRAWCGWCVLVGLGAAWHQAQ